MCHMRLTISIYIYKFPCCDSFNYHIYLIIFIIATLYCTSLPTLYFSLVINILRYINLYIV